MRTSIIATTVAFGIAVAASAQAQQSTAPGQQMQSDKQMQEEADKGIIPAAPENLDLWGNRKSRVLPRIRPGVPTRAAARRRQVRALLWAAARIPKLVALHASTECPEKVMRQKSNLLNSFNLIWVVQLSRQKYSASPFPQISGYFSAVPSRQEGRIAIVTNARRDVVDAVASRAKIGRRAGLSCEWLTSRTTYGAEAYGKTVWS